MSAPARVALKARWAVTVCLLVLSCVAGIGWPSHTGPSEPMAGMTASMQHDDPSTSQPPGHDASGHCVDSGQQCHQATVDSGSASTPTGNATVANAAGTLALTVGAVRPDGPPPRPPDIHALCVNRI